MVPLSMLSSKEEAVIKVVRGGPGLVRRLCEMGFIEGTVIRVLQNEGGGCVVNIRGSKMVISRGLAHKIMVEKVS